MMKNRNLVAIVSLAWALGACQVPDASTNSSRARASNNAEESSLVACDRPDTALSPLTTPEEVPIVYEQFNFDPQDIAIADSEVVVKTPYYEFSFCQGDRTWSIASAKSISKDNQDYSQYLADIADPAYTTLEINGESYQYRIRLQADWLTAQIDEASVDARVGGPPDQDNAVYFELQTPDGDTISRRLYTLGELQKANLGSSLGSPSIAGTVVTGEADNANVWFAASSSQGEGSNGFASLLNYSLQTGDLTVTRPDLLQGDQITSIAATNAGSDPEDLTLWLGTKLSAEGSPNIPANGLVVYQPTTEQLSRYTVTNSPLVGAIPFQLAVADDLLWVATGNGICQVRWQSADAAESWNCWRFAATAELPATGVDLYASVLADEPATTLSESKVEVRWVEHVVSEQPTPKTVRYEVVYEPGFEAQLLRGGYRITNDVAQNAAGGTSVRWPGERWHWRGDRFTRSLDEVSLNMFGGGPVGLVASDKSVGITRDNSAIRGDFDLLSLTSESTQVRYYSGWVDVNALEVYPEIVPVSPPSASQPNPLDKITLELPVQGP